MPNSIFAEGRTTNEAIENGLKQLNAKREDVIINVIGNEEKRSFFSILEPTKIKVELTLKEPVKIKKANITLHLCLRLLLATFEKINCK